MTRADVPFIVLALVTGALLLYLGRSLTFWHDEWRSITFDGGFVDYFRPVNEHWSTFPLALYRATFELVELRSYLPYLAQVIVLHLVAGTGAYVLMRRRVGPFVATLLALPLLLLGAGAENLFWAFQTGFVGSVMFGVWALVFIERPGRSGADRRVRPARRVAHVVGNRALLRGGCSRADRARPLVSDASTGSDSPCCSRTSYGTSSLDGMRSGRPERSPARPRFSASRFAAPVTRSRRWPVSSGFRRGVLGLAVFAGLCAIAVRRIARGQPQGLAAGALIGVASMYVGIGVARADLDVDYARS